MLAPATRFDRYTVESLLGRGGMGAVYRARDERLRRRVALKVVERADGDTTGATARLVREARLAATLSHPNVVAIHDVGEVDGTAFIAMELVEGRSLRSTIGEDVPLAHRLGWLIEIAQALSAAHAAGIIHRDVKPDNVMIRADGHVKVLDFGIAKPVHVATDASAPTDVQDLATLTAAGSILGTPAYMAPEQLRALPLDGRADQFAWGVLAYQLLSGKLPWRLGEGSFSLLSDILMAEPPPLAVHGLDARVVAVVHRTLRKDVGDRFGSMGEVIEELERALSSEAAPAAQPPAPIAPSAPASTSRAPWAKRATLLIATGAAALALIAGRRGPAPVPAPSASASVAAAPPTRGIRLLDLPAPQSSVPAALAAYRRGRELKYGGHANDSVAQFEQAATLDPSMGEATLQLAMARGGSVGDWVSDEARALYARALVAGGRFSARDRELLGALEPIYGRATLSQKALQNAFASLLARHPDDAELHELAAEYTSSFDPAWARAQAERATKLDPDYADAWQALGSAEQQQGHEDAAFRAFDACRRVAPGGVDCAGVAARLLDQTGRCDEAEAEARRIASSAAVWDTPYLLYGQGRPRDLVMRALEASYAAAGEATTAWLEPQSRFRLEHADGDLVSARRFVQELERRTHDSTGESVRLQPALFAATLAHEAGHPATEKAFVEAALAGRGRWTPPSSPWYDDISLRLIAYLREVDARSDADLEREREHFTQRWSAFAQREPTRFWVTAEIPFVMWALPAHPERAQAAARAALKRAPAPLDEHVPWEVGVDRVLPGILLFEAGEVDAAIPWLVRGTRTCTGWQRPGFLMLAHDLLGQALAQKGDLSGACRAWKLVTDHWGKANPRSVTAEDAGRRAAAAGCPR